MDTIIFESQTMNMDEAGVLFRRTVGAVKPLNDSLIGLKPNCPLELDEKEHRMLRKFKDEEGLTRFVEYVKGKIAQTAEPHPLLWSNETTPIHYVVASGRAEIGIRTTTDGYQVVGMATFAYPDTVANILSREGLKVTVC